MADIIAQDKFDKELIAIDPEIRMRRMRQSKYSKSEKGKITAKNYEQSAKGILRRKKYSESDKGIATLNRYLASDKGKEMQKRKQRKKIESSKNAEYCRRYYQKKKMEKLLLEAK